MTGDALRYSRSDSWGIYISSTSTVGKLKLNFPNFSGKLLKVHRFDNWIKNFIFPVACQSNSSSFIILVKTFSPLWRILITSEIRETDTRAASTANRTSELLSFNWRERMKNISFDDHSVVRDNWKQTAEKGEERTLKALSDQTCRLELGFSSANVLFKLLRRQSDNKG